MITLLDIDPNLVKPGWTPLLITLALALIMVFLFRSMRRQFRKINVPTAEEVRRQRTGTPPGPPSGP